MTGPGAILPLSERKAREKTKEEKIPEKGEQK